MTRTARTLALVVALLAAGCSSTASRPEDLSAPPIGSDESLPRASSPPVETFVRGCRTSVFGDLGHNWERHALTVGPISFVGLAVDEPAAAGSMPGQWPMELKVLAVVRATATVNVSPRAAVGLLYDPATFNRANLVSDGHGSVRFTPCSPGRSPHPEAAARETQFNGGVIVSGPVCATFEVTGKGDAPVSAQVPIAGGSCP